METMDRPFKLTLLTTSVVFFGGIAIDVAAPGALPENATFFATLATFVGVGWALRLR